MTKATKTPKLSQTMEEALVYLGRGVHRPHLEPEKRTVLALERRGMIVWSDRAELGAVGGYRVHDLTRLWDVTKAGWAFLAEAYGMERPADDDRLTVEEALEDVVVNDNRMYSAQEITARLRSAHRYGSGNLANPASDSSGITAFFVELGLAVHTAEIDGVKYGYELTPAGEEAARKDAEFHTDEDGDLAMDPDALAAANFAARRPAAPQERGAIRQPGAVTASALLSSAPERCGAVDAGDLDACGKCADCTRPTNGPLDALDAPLTAGQPVVVRRSLYNTLTRSWEPQASMEAVFRGLESDYGYVVTIGSGTTFTVVLPSEVTVDSRLSLKAARDLADLMRRTGLGLDDTASPAYNWGLPAGAWD